MTWDAPILRRSVAADRPPDGNDKPASEYEGQKATASLGRVLIVEDDYFVALTSEAALVDAGFEVLAIIATGEEAVDKATKDRPDVVLMDIRLAGPMDGVETAQQLRAQGIKCLFASAHGDKLTRERGAEVEPVSWLTKPYSDAELVAAVQTALARRLGSDTN